MPETVDAVNTSAIPPAAGINAVCARAYAEPTQAKLTPLRSCTIVGSAVATDVFNNTNISEEQVSLIEISYKL